MKELIPIDAHGLFADTKRRVWANSLFVAKAFHKRHDNVLRDVEQLDCSKEFNALNFEESSYTNQQKKSQPCINMTRDGFTFLVMGYRGKLAAQYKEFYISRFNQMERALIEQELALVGHKPIRRDLTDAIRDNTPPDRLHPYTYSNFTRLAYKAAGVPEKLHQMTAEQINAVQRKEHAISVLMDAGITGYADIKAILCKVV